MIDNLIKEGESLVSDVQENMGRKFFKSVRFETWASKAMLYLENYQKGSVVTEKAKERFKALDTRTNYSFYQFLLGSLKASKEFEEFQDAQAEEYSI
ncbi:hypothetical protein ACFOU2_09740 [Bacillus songklensis]|uniref:Uncharacterized protein n=1 Tax=Bacillus songklensis TaxID=1069116 RepID=A0ABV8B0J1_9BACI